MDIDYQQRNSENMQALISYARERPNPAGNTIDYKQAGQAVLLGKVLLARLQLGASGQRRRQRPSSSARPSPSAA